MYVNDAWLLWKLYIFHVNGTIGQPELHAEAVIDRGRNKAGPSCPQCTAHLLIPQLQNHV